MPTQTPSNQIKINWLELARAASPDPTDLGAGVRRLATLAAAVHRATPAHPLSRPYPPKPQGWATQAAPHQASRVTEDPR